MLYIKIDLLFLADGDFMNCPACGEKSNYVFCEGCAAWLLQGNTEFVQWENPDDAE